MIFRHNSSDAVENNGNKLNITVVGLWSGGL